MKRKIAEYYNVSMDFKAVLDYDPGNDNYVRLTEFIEVDLPDLEKEVIVKNQIAVIDKQITDTQAQAESQINLLKEKKQSLLALPSAI